MLTEVLSLTSPRAFGKAMRAKKYVHHIAEKCQIQSRWQVELATMLSQLGCITLPPEILDRMVAGQDLSPADAEMAKGHHKTAAKLIGNIPRLEQIAKMIALQPNIAAGDIPQDPAADGACILYVALEMDGLIQKGEQPVAAIAALRTRLGERFKPYLEAMAGLDHGGGNKQVRAIMSKDLMLGMVLDEDVRTKTGLLLVGKGQEVTEAVVNRLQGYAARVGIAEPFRVLVPG